MSPLFGLGSLIAGAALLYLGAEWLVRGGAGLARAFRVRPFVVGVTVVAYGTSAPELTVSVAAAIEGRSDIALGNVLGSNIANLGLILGATSLIAPPAVEDALLRREILVLVATSRRSRARVCRRVHHLRRGAAPWATHRQKDRGAVLLLGYVAFIAALAR